ncbi:MAG: hypothetical protein HGA22_09740 [Clostridiales bacterium]|nr:hypothetical protein [Clostridiales bacterium]
MSEYLSHFSAAIWWEVPYISNIIGPKSKDANTANITVSEHDARFRRNGKLVHSCTLDLPAGAVTIRNGKSVASPELLFLELASKLCIHRLILLGLELCAHPPGEPNNSITTEQKLKKFLEKTQGHRGHQNALRAVKYVKNGSASIMESLAFMILTLPNALGGYGLNGAVFNHEILLKSKAGVLYKIASIWICITKRENWLSNMKALLITTARRSRAEKCCDQQGLRGKVSS